MFNRRKSFSLLVLVLLFTVLAGAFIYPDYYFGKFRAWRLGLDLIGGSHLVYEIDMANVESGDRESVAGGLRDVIERRINLYGVSEPQVVVSKTGESYRLLVELAGIKDVKEAIKEIGATPFLTFSEVETVPGQDEPNFKPTNLTGKYVKGAQLTFDNLIGKPEVSITFDDEGAAIFEDLTGRNVGRPIAIFLDNVLIEMPVVQQRISGGKAQITGSFSLEAAKQLVARFNAGALPAPITLVSQATIGASLGSDSLNRTLWAGLLGTLAVMLFMILYYRLLGFAASLALLIYIVLTATVFKLFGITMTLAGIAGFILSIGMAVDANVLIFERNKEEAKKGVSKIGAIAEGFKRAWPSIRDSNISTMITAVILYYATTGFVKGFALALFIGVLMSMFSAITVTRVILGSFIKSSLNSKS